MRESRTYGSVRGALRNERPYRDRCAGNDGRGSGIAEPVFGRAFARWLATTDARREHSTCSPHNSRALLNANDDTRLVFSSKINVRVIGGSARWLQFSRSQSRQLTPIGVPSVFSRSIPVA